MNRDYDFRDTEPAWAKYLVKINSATNEDKFYEVRIDPTDEGDFCLTKRWGRRPDKGKGQIKPEYYTSFDRARGVADAMINDKIREGYFQMERPSSANSQVEYDEDIDEAG